MSKRSVYSKWIERIRVAEEYKKKVINPKMIKRFLSYFKGDWFTDTDSEDRIAVNQVFPNVKILQSALALNQPTFKAVANDPKKRSREPIIESLLNTSFKKMKFKNTLKKIVRDAHLNWGGVCQSGYNFRLTSEAEKIDPSTEKGQVSQAIYHECIKEDSTYGIRVSPNMFFMDPDATETL